MSTIQTDPRQLLKSLDADAIRQRLSEVEDERKALLTLLRVARRNDHSPAKSIVIAAPEGERR